MPGELKRVIESLSKEKGLSKEIVVEALIEGIRTAAKKRFGNKARIEVKYNEEKGDLEIYKLKKVVEEVKDKEAEISIEEAQKIYSHIKSGDIIGERVELQDLGRIAAQNCKTAFFSKIKTCRKTTYIRRI